MTFVLTQVEARVLGSLIEKETTTPDYYPLSLNALLNACNQTSNREPVTRLDEDAVRQALHTLQQKNLARPSGGADSRVAKYEHHLETFNFGRREIAVLCVLLLRGPQTPGELRSRTERLYHFDELSDLQSTLQRLMQGDPPLVTVLPRRPGTKEARYAHLFCGDVESNLDGTADRTAAEPSATSGLPSSSSGLRKRILKLEEQVTELRSEVATLKLRLADSPKTPRDAAPTPGEDSNPS